MKLFLHSLKPAAISLALLTLLMGIVYPLFMWGVGQLFFHRDANGSLFRYKDGEILGSEWIGQNFSSSHYFHPRPSSAGAQGYDASNSSGSNLGPTSQKLIDSLRNRANGYRTENLLAADAEIPGDAAAASGSGLDPHISVENAKLQAARVAQARGVSVTEVLGLVERYTEDPFLWLLGNERVNVLRLNLALDKNEGIE